MNRRSLLSLYALVMLLQHVVVAQGRTLLAEGDSVALTKSGTKARSHWKLWRANGGYEVVDTDAQNSSAIEIFRFDSQFMPIGFTKKSGPLTLPDARFPTLPGYEISCEYNAKELICESAAGDGTRSTASIAAEAPYVVIGEFYDLDYLWFMTGVVHLALKGAGGLVNTYALVSNGPKDIGLKADKPLRVLADGNGSAMELGRMQPVRQYKLGAKDGRELIGTDQGLISRVRVRPNAEFGFAVDNYKEYEPWSVRF